MEIVCEEVYVGVGKDMLQNVSTLQWTLHNKPADSLVLLHVHLPITTIPSLFGKIPVKRGSVLEAHEEDKNRKLHDCMTFYLQICSQAKVKAKASIVTRSDVGRGIVEMISELGIRKLVMGTSSAGTAKSKRKMKRPGKAGYVLSHAINSCDISIVCKGKIVSVRERSVVDKEDFGRSFSSLPNFPTDSAAPIKTPGNFSDERAFTLSIVGDCTAANSELSSDIKVVENQELDGDETHESTEKRTANKILKFVLTEGMEETENARGEVNAKVAAIESPRKFRAVGAGLGDAVLSSKVKDGYCQTVTRRPKEVEEEFQAMVENRRSLATQLTRFSYERHQAIQELHTAQERLAAVGMQNFLILKEKEEKIKRLQDLLHSRSRLETSSCPCTNVEISKYSSKDMVRGFWGIIFTLIYSLIYHIMSYIKYQVE